MPENDAERGVQEQETLQLCGVEVRMSVPFGGSGMTTQGWTGEKMARQADRQIDGIARLLAIWGVPGYAGPEKAADAPQVNSESRRGILDEH